VNSGFRREVTEKPTTLGHYAASSANCLPTFRDNPSIPRPNPSLYILRRGYRLYFGYLNPEEKLYLNFGKKLPLLAT